MSPLKRIDGKIARIVTNSAKLNELIHETGMDILRHAQEHGDCTRALKLAQAMPASMRRAMLIAWFSKFSPVTVKLGDDPKVGINKGKTANAYDLEAAGATPFYQMAEDTPETKEYTLAELVKMVQTLGKRIKSKADKGEVADNDREAAVRIAGTLEAFAA